MRWNQGDRYLLRLGRRIGSARRSVSMPQKAFADELCLPRKLYRRIERGKVDPPARSLVAIADMTGQDLDFLLRGTSRPVR